MSEIDGRDTYLLIALDARGAVPGGTIGASFHPDQNIRLGKLVKAGLIVQNAAGDDGAPFWRLTEAGMAFLADVARELEALVERMAYGAI